MKKQVLSLLLAGALTLGLFGCSAQTPEESGVPQSAPAQTEGTDSAGTYIPCWRRRVLLLLFLFF